MIVVCMDCGVQIGHVCGAEGVSHGLCYKHYRLRMAELKDGVAKAVKDARGAREAERARAIAFILDGDGSVVGP